MPREHRAVIFDLDDTLYPYRRFLASGFRAIAAHLAETHGSDRLATLRTLIRASRGPARGREIQVCLAALQLPDHLAGTLAAQLRDHTPSLRLPRISLRTLAALRGDGWRIGVLTNGDPAVQARKCEALALAPHVDAIVFASQHGSGAGKPEVEPFLHACRLLETPASRAVMVGDSEECDVAGALAAGMAAIRCLAWIRSAPRETRAAHVVDRLSHVPALLRAVEDRRIRHVA
jgi:putative hydrolase of the HAD superfamily